MRALLLAAAAAAAMSGTARAADEVAVERYRDVRGAIVFRTYCVLCHGPNADGQGRAAASYTPRPANLVASKASDRAKEQIIRRGGAAVGRSPFMPPWEHELTPEQIRDVVYYLRVISEAPRGAAPGK